MLFAEIRRRAEATGVGARQAVITVPANSKGRARHRTKICAGMGGFEVLGLINEPTAAAMAYAQRNSDGRNYVVFDENLISIVKKYGLAGAVSMGLISQQMAEQMEDQGAI